MTADGVAPAAALIGFSDFRIGKDWLFFPNCCRAIHWNESDMDIAAEILLMLTAFSLKTQFITKAVIYGRAGAALYPEDHRFREMLGYALLLDGKLQEAAAVVGEGPHDTCNLAYLKSRLLMLGDHSTAERQEALRTYLNGKVAE